MSRLKEPVTGLGVREFHRQAAKVPLRRRPRLWRLTALFMGFLGAWTTSAGPSRPRTPLSTPELPNGCIFCARDRADLNKIFLENRTCYARMDNFPVAPGHAEIVPKRHVESFFDLSKKEFSDACTLLTKASRELTNIHHPDGYTIGINEGSAAGRTVDHLHIHLIPRKRGDVKDPRGGVRQVIPDAKYHPDDWQKNDTHGGAGEKRPAKRPVSVPRKAQ